VKKIQKPSLGGGFVGIDLVACTEKIGHSCIDSDCKPDCNGINHILDGEGYWDSGKVRRILQNKVYTGTVVNGRTRVTEIGGRHFKPMPDEEQICAPGRHEAIVTEREYLLALEVLKNNGCQKGKKHTLKQESVLLGKARCGHCKRSLLRSGCATIPYFICKKAEYEENTECIGERLSEPELEIAILEYINEELEQVIPDGENQSQESDTDFPVMDHKQIRKMCKALEQKQDSLKIEKQYLYEQYKRNQMERKIYLNRGEALRQEERSLSEQIKYLQEARGQCEEKVNMQQKEEHTGKLKTKKSIKNC